MSHDQFNEKIGALLKTKREDLGLTQEQIGELILNVRQTVSNVETGKSGLESYNLYFLCKFFGISTKELQDALKSEKAINEANPLKQNLFSFYMRLI